MKIKKTESTPPSCEPLGRFVSALVMASLLGVVLPAFAQQGYEAPPVLSASKILPTNAAGTSSSGAGWILR